jgi:hypothetical protein
MEHKTPIKHQNQIQSMNNNYKLMSGVGDDASSKNSSMNRRANNDDDYDSIVNPDNDEIAVNKQKHLSDWYYIKTSPKTKPASPYERRKVKNFLHHPPAKPLHSTDTYNRSSIDKISSINDESSFIPMQKYRSNDYIEHHNYPQLVYEDKSPLQSHKCFSMKYSKNPSGRSDFKHVKFCALNNYRYQILLCGFRTIDQLFKSGYTASIVSIEELIFGKEFPFKFFFN